MALSNKEMILDSLATQRKYRAIEVSDLKYCNGTTQVRKMYAQIGKRDENIAELEIKLAELEQTL